MRRTATGLVVLGVLALGCAVGLQKIRSFDYWWQLRTGAWILEHGEVPRTDVYTYTVPGARYIDIHWLHQLGLYGVHALGGHEGVVVAKAVLICALAALLGSIGFRRERAWLTGLALGGMMLAASDRFMPRPELPSFLLLAGVLALLERHARRGDRAVWAVVPLQLVWVNVHGLFAVGLAVVAIYWLGELLRPLIAPGERLDRTAVLRLGGVLAVSCAASLLNPNGLDGALYPFEQLGMIGPPEQRGVFGSLIAELVPPLGGGRGGGMLPLAASTALGLATLGAMVANWRRLPGAHPVLFVAFAYLALSATRNLALFAIVCVPILVQNAGACLDRHPPGRWLSAGLAGTTALALFAAAAAFATGRASEGPAALREPGLGVLEVLYPMGAFEWIAEVRPAGPLFHHMADGGYLLWRLYPDYRSMVDGRLEVFGSERFLELQVATVEQFQALDERYAFGAAVLHYSLVESSELMRWLYFNSNWRLGYVDETAVVYFRVDRNDLDWVRPVEVDAPDLFPPLPEERSASDLARRIGRTHFYSIMRRHDRALASWEDVIRLHPGLEQGPIVHATLLSRAGYPAAAEAILRRLLEEAPGDPKLLSQMGDLRWEGGDLAAAAELYDRALESDQGFPYASLRRGMVAEALGRPDEALLHYGRAAAYAPPADPLAAAAQARLQALSAGSPGPPGVRARP